MAHPAMVLVWAFAAQTAIAGTERYCSRPVKVALFEFGVLFRASNGDGIDSRLLDTLEKKTGCMFERVVMPRKRIWVELEAGTLDMATGAIPTPERRAFAYALPYFIGRNLVLVRSNKAAQAKTPQALEASTLRLGVVRSFKHEPYYDALADRLAAQPGRVVEAADVEESLRMLDRGVVDMVFSQPIVFNEYLSAEKLSALVVRDWAPRDQFAVGALMLQHRAFTPSQAQAWDALVKRMVRDGSLNRIYRRFMPAAQARSAVYTGPRMLD